MECMTEGDDVTLEARVTAFLADRDAEIVAGPRRMGREELVCAVMGIASANGLRCYASESAPKDADVVAFAHWQGMDVVSVREMWPEADILFGQDLCHQVPAVVRLRRGL